MNIAVLNETAGLEARAALTPETCAKLAKSGHTVRVESGAGLASGFSDAAYAAAGARVSSDRAALLDGVNILARVTRPGPDVLDKLPAGAAVIGFLQPLADKTSAPDFAKRGLTAIALELVPRITRAQFMDALSSMATVAGYKAALIAANSVTRFFPMLTTAAGTIKPAKVIVIGAGVAGLQAIATARRLGAEVIGYDVRPAAGEQIRSLGAQFEPMEAAHAEDAGGYATEQSAEFYKQEQELIRKHSRDADAIISTALVPGKRAPLLITRAMVEEMRHGSVIVDLSAAAGGNCELTLPDEEVRHGGVLILGPTNLPSTMPEHASQLYGRNMAALIGLLAPDPAGPFNLEDEVVKGALVTANGEIVHQAVKALVA